MNLLRTRFQDSRTHHLYFPYEGDERYLFCNLEELSRCKDLPLDLKEDLEYALYYFYFVEVLPILEYAELVAKNKYKINWYLWYKPEEEERGK